MIIKYLGPWEDVATGRHVISAHRSATDDLTVAFDPDNCQGNCPGHIELRPGEVVIDAAERDTLIEQIRVENEAHLASLDAARRAKDAADRQAQIDEIDGATLTGLKAILKRERGLM